MLADELMPLPGHRNQALIVDGLSPAPDASRLESSIQCRDLYKE